MHKKSDKDKDKSNFSDALFSPCRKWRYSLTRRWQNGKNIAAFIGLNPSTADELYDDPTVRRCINFAKDWGYDGMWMLNVFAFRATDPRALQSVEEPIGVDNDAVIVRLAKRASLVVCAWGVHGTLGDRHLTVCRNLQKAGVPLSVLKLTTKGGHPNHPLYLPKALQPRPWAGYP